MLGTLTEPGHKRYYKAATICPESNVDFVQNEIGPTGMGEPAYPPVFGALANALYKATGKRFRSQPFTMDLKEGNG